MTEQEFWKILLDAPEVQPVFYRAYYNEQGWVKTYTMEDLPGNYIEVDQPTYVLSPYARVINGKLHPIKPASLVSKLTPGESGTSCDVRDICIVVDHEPNTKWSLTSSEIN
jgi:hypothetical protein